MRDFWKVSSSPERAEAVAAMAADYPEDGAHVAEQCHDHPEQERHSCAVCHNEDEGEGSSAKHESGGNPRVSRSARDMALKGRITRLVGSGRGRK